MSIVSEAKKNAKKLETLQSYNGDRLLLLFEWVRSGTINFSQFKQYLSVIEK